ncbi:TonB-dependent SusC/RagA subfamily outer membrane receptor [Lacibacter cauensis]|uniref:TonB-dependent SusC/RagA subfamily outer membrane receptor n=1 Tax=Lacibacter cauensis TaxID=510947 RepID=A0A562SK13_9BACT|nr:TonB-dependent receptor plug domain-containing protein [Lacibacter cauensis]TWI81443.1 TonB-dependent SusC/RagA subfamily outer membrane receptor [Lacibacter cauensis]
MRLLFTVFLLSTCLLLTAQVKPSLPVKTTVQPRVFDGKMILQRCSVAVKTDGITAVTFIELEFYNNRDTEIEGLYRFNLRKGQVVTDFQLELNGQYREGSIEERWKATNAYNTIVGKRIDPALLVKEYDNTYSLRIYPVPAMKSRKVTIALHEVLPIVANEKTYLLPFDNNDVTTAFSFRFEAIIQTAKPFFRSLPGSGAEFTAIPNGFLSTAEMHSVVLNKAVDVVLPLTATQILVTKPAASKFYFALQLHKELSSYYAISPKTVTVFWDASASSAKRDTKKEISFLKQYLLYHQTKTVTVIPFRHKPFDTVVYNINSKTIRQLEQYLTALTYEGATGIGRLNFATVSSTVTFLFSDGYNSFGKRMPTQGNTLLYALHSAPADSVYLKAVAGSGGAVVDLRRLTIDEAIEKTSQAERMLMAVESVNGKTIIESALPVKIDQPILIYGSMHVPTDTLRFYYGNNQLASNVEVIPLSTASTQVSSGIDRLKMLMRYREATTSNDWNDVLDFGLDERVVTQRTAFLVLERVEDYIRFNIAPPKDLEEECRRLNYVKKDTRMQRRAMDKQPTETNLNSVVELYNQRIKNWDASATLLQYKPGAKPVVVGPAPVRNEMQQQIGETSSVQTALQGHAAGISIERNNELSEVVVVGYSSAKKREMTGSVAYVQQRDVFQGYTNIGEVLAGRVAGMQVTGNSGVPGAIPDIRIRGAVSLGASAQPLYVIDGMPVKAETVFQSLNMNDIESITVLKDASATALYGSRAANGAIVIQLKKGKNYTHYYYRYRKYKMSEQEDVEYLQEMKSVALSEKIAMYQALKMEYGQSAAFHVDMAEHLFSCGFNSNALAALMTAMELVPNDFYMHRTAVFILERWKQYSEAEELLTDLLSVHAAELYLYRDLAWVYYQQQKYQQSVDLLYQGINVNFGSDEGRQAGLKAVLLNDMNAMIELHRAKLDLSAINPTLIKALSADLLIVAEDNERSRLNLQINEPGVQSMVLYGHPSKNGGFVATEKNSAYVYGSASGIETYTIKTASKGKYKVTVNYYAGRSYNSTSPSYIRLCVFRNFGKPDQSIQVETIAMDNQYGEIEIAAVGND